MNRYTQTLTLTLPYTPELAAIAASIGRALDPDNGGAESFSRDVISTEGDVPVYGDTLRCSTPCTAEFYVQALVMLANPALLHGAVAQDYAARWADMTPPTLAEVEQFLVALTAQSDTPDER